MHQVVRSRTVGDEAEGHQGENCQGPPAQQGETKVRPHPEKRKGQRQQSSPGRDPHQVQPQFTEGRQVFVVVHSPPCIAIGFRVRIIPTRKSTAPQTAGAR